MAFFTSVATEDETRLNELGRRAKARRLAMGLTQAEAAAKGGISHVPWIRVEKGVAGPADRTYHGVEVALEWPSGIIQRFLEGGEPPPTDAPDPQPVAPLDLGSLTDDELIRVLIVKKRLTRARYHKLHGQKLGDEMTEKWWETVLDKARRGGGADGEDGGAEAC